MSQKSWKRNPEAFKKLWRGAAEPWFEEHRSEPGVTMPDSEMAMAGVMAVYHRLNKYCSDTYMKNPDAPLNQRKVAACVAYAIVIVRPIQVDLGVEGCDKPCIPGRPGSIPALANERLAISVALSTILSFLDHAVHDEKNCKLTEAQRADAEAQIARGVNLLAEKDGGQWILNLEKSLALRFMTQPGLEGGEASLTPDGLDDERLAYFDIPLLSCLFAYLEGSVLDDVDTYREVQRCFLRVGSSTGNAWHHK